MLMSESLCDIAELTDGVDLSRRTCRRSTREVDASEADVDLTSGMADALFDITLLIVEDPAVSHELQSEFDTI